MPKYTYSSQTFGGNTFANWTWRGLSLPLNLPSGRKPISVMQQPHGAAGWHYPLDYPSDDVKHLLGDMWLSYDDEQCEHTFPFHIAWMYGFGSNVVSPPPGFPTPTHGKDMIITDNDGNVVFDSTTAIDYVIKAWPLVNPRLLTMEWKTETEVLRVTMHTAWPVGVTPTVYDNYIVPEQARIDSRAVSRLPRRVRRLKTGVLTLDAGDVRIESGFNFQTVISSVTRVDGGRFVNRIVVHATPGLGLGRQPGCQDPLTVIKRINGVTADDGGNFTLDADGCYRVQRPVEIVSTNPRQAELTHDGAALQLFNDCGPCCECNDFVETYLALKRLHERYLSLGSRAEVVRNQFQENIDRWERQRSCRTLAPLRLALQQEYQCQLAVGALHCNMTQCCITPLTLRLTFQIFNNGVLEPLPPDAEILCGQTKRQGTDTDNEEQDYTMNGTFPVLDTVFDSSDPQNTSRMRTRLRFQGCEDGQALVATLTAHHPDPVQQPDEPACAVIPTVEVPDDIQAIWTSEGNPSPGPVRAILQKTLALIPGRQCDCGTT